MRGQFRGEWWADGGSGGGAVVLLVIGAALLFGSGAAVLATAIMVALIAAAAVLALTVAGLGAWLVYRARRGQAVMRPSVIITSPDRGPLPPTAPAGALEPPAAREVHQHWHLHVGAGADAEQVAAIMRQIRNDQED